MKVLTKTEYEVLENLFQLNQSAVHYTMRKYLRKYYKNTEILETKDYLCAVGDIPIALVAHMDTVWENKLPKYIFYDTRKGAIWSPGGLGADDKAGLFAIIKILEAGLRPHVILTHDEERGGTGAEALATLGCPFNNLKYLIELDRQGSVDCVFYDCDNRDFMKYIESFGFETAQGTFSDISILCPAWKICGVNLSIGYINEHSALEMLFVQKMFNTINKVKQMLVATEIPNFTWEEIQWNPLQIWRTFADNSSIDGIICCKCKQVKPFNDLLPVTFYNENYSSNLKTYHHYCFDCLTNSPISFCTYCDDAFEEPGGQLGDSICPACKAKGGAYLDYATYRD